MLLCFLSPHKMMLDKCGEVAGMHSGWQQTRVSGNLEEERVE